ncbi:tRNA uridine-5-carboxymethylaminomethyl(34) synthesis GTPase MnmE [Thermoflexibacter ruber]|uniref:tRNA modification GTPase MnmE n=1 Tax=Thermoflexibacter ruber TaxID=1003 RepID=A0A1I2G5W8_9BACT|nr:tRNA uridine-5-carboxymethylaminomethyl(34) synthesis GTPase MnmE [Thermoflexibacter ruber]SFF12021.1 tRNA modification GTPase trmE [Thermoflexibacter ruber]
MHQDTIIALATAQGIGAISVIRLSGKQAIKAVNQVFHGKDLEKQPTHTLHFGTIRDGNEIIDEVVVSLFVEPKSFTGENVVEISCHGSPYIVKRVLQLFINQGVRLAKAGEFTQRAFLNGKFDLAQAEAVADLIAADSEAAHRAAMYQMRGGFSQKIKELREKLIHFASLIELELDFGEEDVEFADREDLRVLVKEILAVIQALIQSFSLGNVIKNGVPTVIAGKPNAGKSTLLNALLNEERAIVSEIAGTTRDVIEDEIVIEGMVFRFIDTAGLRETEDKIEKIGVQRSYEKIKSASLLLYVFDLTEIKTPQDYEQELADAQYFGIPYIMVGNKVEYASDMVWSTLSSYPEVELISAKNKEGLENLKQHILKIVQGENFSTGDTFITNARHYESLLQTKNALDNVLAGLNRGVTGDFLAMDIRQALYHLGEITGQITTDDLLANIFSKFCIGK